MLPKRQAIAPFLILLILSVHTGCTAPEVLPPATNLPIKTQILPTQPISAVTLRPSATNQPAQKFGANSIPPLSTENSFLTERDDLSRKDTFTATPAPQDWRQLPVIPAIDPRVQEIFQRGVELGNNSNAFSKVGDCGSTPAWFLGDFDNGPKYYRLGEYTYLEPVIQEFQGSYGRTSLAAKSGFNASSVFASLWANRDDCQPNETPIECEFRLHRPSFVFVMLGSNDVYHQDTFEPMMRKIIDYSIDQGVVPILSTKADDKEGDSSLNATIAKLALEYRLPLINYWRAVQPLPDHGLQEDAVHITWGPNRFDDPMAMQRGWPVRNLTALQILDSVWRQANGQARSGAHDSENSP